MENFEQNENVVLETKGHKVDKLEDSAFLKTSVDYDVFRKWSWYYTWHKKYVWKFIIVFLVMLVGSFVAMKIDNWLTSMLFGGSEESLQLISYFIDIIFGIGLLGFSLNIAKGIDSDVGDFFKNIMWSRFWKIFVGSILFSLVCCVGFILLIIPGIIFSARFQFFSFAIIDRGLGPIDALKYSWRITEGHIGEIVGFDLYFGCLNFLGLLCLLVGMFGTLTMMSISIARYYILLSNMYDKKNGGNNGTIEPDGPVIYIKDESESIIQPVDPRINSINGTGVNLNNDINSTSVQDGNIDLKNININELTPIGAMERPTHNSDSNNL